MWGSSSGPNDLISSQMTMALSSNSPWNGSWDGVFPEGSIDSREIFYTHNVTATKELCIPCFDSLLTHFRGEAYQYPNPGNLECPLFVRWEKEFADSDDQGE